MKSFLKILIACVLKRPALILTLTLLLSALSLWHAATHLRFDTNQDNLISPKQKYFQDYTGFLKEFGDWEYLYAVIEVDGKPQQAKRMAQELAERLRARSDLYSKATEKIAVERLQSQILYLLPENQFRTALSAIEQQGAAVNSFLKISNSAEWYAWIRSTLSVATQFGDAQILQNLWPFLKNSLAAPFEKQKASQQELAEIYTKVTGQYVDQDGFLFTRNGKLLLVEILPQKDYTSMEIVREPLTILRQQLDELKTKYDLKAGVTGRPALQNDESVSTGNDSEWAGIGSFVFVGLLFLIFIKDVRLTALCLAALLFGITISTGFVSVAIGSVNLLTIVFAVILIGMGMDYGIHFLLHYQMLKAQNMPIKDAVLQALRENGEAILLSALLTAIGFSTAVFTDFLGLQQLGIIVGVGVVVCCLVQLTAFPAQILLFDRPYKNVPNTLSRFTPLLHMVEICARRPKTILLISILLAAGVIPFILRVKFDFNLLNLQDPNQESVRYEQMIHDVGGESTWFLATKTKNWDDLKRWTHDLQKLPSVGRVESILNVLPDQPQERQKLLQATLAKITSLPARTSVGSLDTELAALEKQFQTLAEKAFSTGDADAFSELDAMAQKLASYRTQLKTYPLFQAPYESEFLPRLRKMQNLISSALTAKPLNEADLPQELLRRYKSPNGFYSLMIIPKKDIWQWKNLKEFLSQVQNVIPDVTGAPVTTYESAVRMENGFHQIAVFTSVIVFLLLVLSFREIKAPLLISLKLLLTFWFIFAFMGLTGLNLNLANFFALPILIGSNVDHGVYLFHHYREHGSFPKLVQFTVPPIFLSCATNIVGFISLALVRHKGLASFGLIMSIGTFLSLVMTLVWLPSVIKILYAKKTPHH